MLHVHGRQWSTNANLSKVGVFETLNMCFAIETFCCWVAGCYAFGLSEILEAAKVAHWDAGLANCRR